MPTVVTEQQQQQQRGRSQSVGAQSENIRKRVLTKSHNEHTVNTRNLEVSAPVNATFFMW
jgi:hypothetical protein